MSGPILAAPPGPSTRPIHSAHDLRQGQLYALGAALLFGSAYVATAFQLRSFAPLSGALWRSALATVVVIVAVVLGALPPALPAPAGTAQRARLARLAILGVFGGLLFIVGLNLAVKAVGATIPSFVAGLYAVLAALLAPVVLGERLGRSSLAGFVVALVGAALLAELDPTSTSVPALVAAFAAAVSFALYLVLARRWSRPYGLGATLATAALGLLAFLLVTDPGSIVPAAPSPVSLLALGWLVVASVGGQLLVVASVRRIDARRSAAILLLNPITATILSALLLGERLAPVQVAGGGLVLLGMGLSSGLLWDPCLRAPEPARPAPSTGEMG